MRKADIGAMTEELVVRTAAPARLAVMSLTQTGGLATVITEEDHELVTGEYARVAGATPSGFNLVAPVTVTGPKAFTYEVSSGLGSPATGAITATYESDAQGVQQPRWSTVATIWGELVAPFYPAPQERIAAGAVQAQTNRRFRVYARNDLRAEVMQIRWAPSAFFGDGQRTLNLNAVMPIPEEPMFMALETTEIAHGA